MAESPISMTYLIVPAWSDQAGQCRIVARELDGKVPDGRELQHYRDYSDEWKDVGLMNSRGRVVFLTAPAEVLQEFRDCEPLMAGMVVRSAPVPEFSPADDASDPDIQVSPMP